jgi:hypothetical protein
MLGRPVEVLGRMHISGKAAQASKSVVGGLNHANQSETTLDTLCASLDSDGLDRLGPS